MFFYFKELYHYRELLYNVVIREIKVRYRQTILGIAWAILQPLSVMLLFGIIFSKFIKLPTDGIPYPLFYYSGLLPWTFFSSSLSFAIPSLVTNRELIGKVYFPREIFPLASVITALIDFGIAALIFVCMLVFYKVHITLNFVYILAVIIIQIIFTLGICLFASAVNVYYRDVRYCLPLLIQLWMFASPVIYPVSSVPKEFKAIYMLNPMAVIIDSFRRVIVQGLHPDFYCLNITAFSSALIFIICYKYFKYVEMNFADVI